MTRNGPKRVNLKSTTNFYVTDVRAYSPSIIDNYIQKTKSGSPKPRVRFNLIYNLEAVVALLTIFMELVLGNFQKYRLLSMRDN